MSDPPYDEKWIDDRVWFSYLLYGEQFVGEFVLNDDGEALLRYKVELEADFGARE